MLSLGCRQCGLIAWVVERQEPDGRWHVVSKAVDHKGHAIFSGRTAGEGDLVLITPAPIYAVGDAIEHDGLQHTVAADLGDAVEVVVPPSRAACPLKGGGHLHDCRWQRRTISKADLTLEKAMKKQCR